MNFDEAKKAFIEGYLSLGCELMEDRGTSLIFRSGRPGPGCIVYQAFEEDINCYAQFVTRKPDFKNTPSQCSLCNKEYYEQILDYSYARLVPRIWYLLEKKGTGVTFKCRGQEITAEIGTASTDFFNYFRFDKGFTSSFSINSVTELADYYNIKQQPMDFRECLHRFKTIKVSKLGTTSIDEAIRKSLKIIEACCFQLSYLKRMNLWLMEEWPSNKPQRNNTFSINEDYKGWEFVLSSSFNSEIIRFYQFAQISNITEMKFLSLYQVLEYFFVQVSNEKLYDRLSNKIKDPKFTLTNNNLGNLAHEVLKHKNETDETEMLKNVLKKYVDEQELINFITAYQKFLGKQIFTDQHTVFGVQMQIRLEIGQTSSNIAKEIKEIRNALVHSTDRYEYNVRHVPFTKSTGKIEEVIPLMEFLAQKIIVNSSTPNI